MDAKRPFFHRHKHLHILARVPRQKPVHASRTKADDAARHILRRSDLFKQEVLRSGRELRRLTIVDAVRIFHDHAALCLAVDVRKPHDGHRSAFYDVPKHVSCAHRRKLIRIAHHQKAGAWPHRTQQRMHERHIHHGHFIHNDKIRLDRVLFIPQEALTAVAIFQQTMDGARGNTRRLRHAFCGTACRRTQLAGKAHALNDAEDKAQDSRFARAGAACYNERPTRKRADDSLPLLLRKGDRKLPFEQRHLPFRIQEQKR